MSVVELQLINPQSKDGTDTDSDQLPHVDVNNHNRGSPAILQLGGSTPTTPTTNGGPTPASHTGFKSGKVLPSPLAADAHSATQMGVRKGAWERAQEQFEAQEEKAKQQSTIDSLDINYTAGGQCCNMQKVSSIVGLYSAPVNVHKKFRGL